MKKGNEMARSKWNHTWKTIIITVMRYTGSITSFAMITKELYYECVVLS